MMALRCPDVVVVVGADRVAASRRARSLGAEVIVLDSGFQHRRLHRDLDIVSVSQDTFRAGELLPLGELREPLTSLSRADLIAIEVGRSEAERLPSDSMTFQLFPKRLAGRGLEPLEEIAHLDGKRVMLVAGIARPERFARTATKLGVEVVAASMFPDHHRFTAHELRCIAATVRSRGAELLLTTEKDLVRLGDVPGCRVRALRVDVVFESGEEMLAEALEGL